MEEVKREMLTLSDFALERLVNRIADLGEAEYWWEPAPDTWSLGTSGVVGRAQVIGKLSRGPRPVRPSPASGNGRGHRRPPRPPGRSSGPGPRPSKGGSR